MLNIYLADLVYDSTETNHVVPLNVACLAAYAKNIFGNSIKIKIFKYPLELEKEIKLNPPDVLGLSNYSWNERLNHHFCEIVKGQDKQITTILGGPNIRLDEVSIEKYLNNNKNIDYYIVGEGEIPFVELLKNFNLILMIFLYHQAVQNYTIINLYIHLQILESSLKNMIMKVLT